MRRLILLAVLASMTAFLMVNPAVACACGALVTDDDVGVDGETALITHDGRTEQIVMGLALNGSPHDAAWILPVPADPSFALGSAGLFTDLAQLTRPRIVVDRDWFPAPPIGLGGGDGASPGDGASLIDRVSVGPYDVATLAASDGEALTRWLSGHGFRLDPTLAAGFRPYADAGWLFVAVKLAAPDGQPYLEGLPPLRVRFATPAVVYPMRLTALATETQHLRLYLLAEHRMRPAGPVGPDELQLRFAGWVSRAQVAGTTLAALVDGRRFLTRYDQVITEPQAITDDYRFVAADADSEYQDVRHVTEPVYLGGILPAGPALIGLGLVVVAAASVAVGRIRHARRRRLVPDGS